MNCDHVIVWQTGKSTIPRCFECEPPAPGKRIRIGLITPDGGVTTPGDIRLNIIRANKDLENQRALESLETEGWDTGRLETHRPTGALRPVAKLGPGRRLAGEKYPKYDLLLPDPEICLTTKESEEIRRASEESKRDYAEYLKAEEEVKKRKKAEERKAAKERASISQPWSPESSGYKLLKPIT